MTENNKQQIKTITAISGYNIIGKYCLSIYSAKCTPAQTNIVINSINNIIFK